MNPHRSLRRSVAVVTSFFALTACRDLGIPDPHGPGPGSLQATLLYAEPGRPELLPAVGATVELLRSSLATTVTEANGHFTLAPITASTGTVLVRFDPHYDGKNRQRVISLAEVGAGLGHDVSLGPVVLGGNATVRGTVIPRDRVGQLGGFSGTTVFVPEGPFLTYTGDNGGFTLGGLPEGRITLTFFRQGYASSSTQLTLSAAQVFDLNTVLLEPQGQVSPVRVSGTVRLDGVSDFAGVTVTLTGVAAPTTTDTLGRYSFEAVSAGLHAVGFEKTGFKSAVLNNVLVEVSDLMLPEVTLYAGASVPPTLDAGPLFDADAGRDSGVPDAGALDSGVRDGGELDAGLRPVAIVEPVMPSYPIGTQVTLVGQNSLGDRPLTFHWSQDAGPTLVFSSNDSPLAATPRVTLPSTTAFMRLALVVTDTHGVASAPAEFTLVALSGTPLAIISPPPPATVYASQRFSVGSVGSSDPSGSGLSTWEWAVIPGDAGVVLSPQGTGSTVDVVIPATVSVALPMTMQLVVTNGLGVRSSPATAPFTLSSGPAPTWSLDAGVLQVVPGGSTVTLRASTTTPAPGPTFTFDWTPTGVVDAGTSLLNWQLSTPNAAQTQFIAPLISGLSQNIVFSVTATNTSGGLSPAQRTTSVMVQVQDQRPPQFIGTSLTAMTGSPFGAWVDFDEDLQAASTSGMTVTATSSPAAPNMRPAALLGTRRVRVIFDWFAYDNTPLQLATGSPRDLSLFSGGNAALSQNIPYVARFLWPAPAAAVASSTEPNPAVVLAVTPQGEATAWLVARKETAAVFHNVLPLESCLASGCSVSEDTTGPVVPLSGTAKRVGTRVAVVSGLTYVLLQSADYAGTPGAAVVRTTTGWAAIAAPPGTLFTDGTTLYSAYVESTSVKVAAYDPGGNSWLTPSIVVTSATDYTTGVGSLAAAWGKGQSTGALWLLVRTAAGDMRAYTRAVGSTTWGTTNWGGAAGGTDPVREARIAAQQSADGTMFVMVLRQSGTITIDAMGPGGSGTYGTFASQASAFDVWSDVNTVWLATIENGQLMVRPRGLGFTALPGPLRAGPPNSLNNDLACTADSPAIQRAGEHVVVAWQERCGGGPWRAYLRWLR